MMLETEITKLTEQVSHLNELLAALLSTKSDAPVAPSPTAHVTDHALITWLSCTEYVAEHALFTWLITHLSRDITCTDHVALMH